MRRNRAILITGPTASGKSAIATAIATTFDGIIVNADSIQVYNELKILSARPNEADEQAYPHHLYGHIPIKQPYSVAQWLADVQAVLEAPKNRDRVTIIVGGTGLYFKALTEGLSPIPDIPSDVRQHYRDLSDKISAPKLHDELSRRDPQTANKLQPTDTQRLVRALEVFEATGTPLAEWQQISGKPLLASDDYQAFVINPERDALQRAADRRFDAMMETGALNEAEKIRSLIIELQLPHDLPALQALGLKPLMAHLEGEISRETAIEQTKSDTRRYIKRQKTWLKRYNNSWKWLNTKELERISRDRFAFIDFFHIDRHDC